MRRPQDAAVTYVLSFYRFIFWTTHVSHQKEKWHDSSNYRASEPITPLWTRKIPQSYPLPCTKLIESASLWNCCARKLVTMETDLCYTWTGSNHINLPTRFELDRISRKRKRVGHGGLFTFIQGLRIDSFEHPTIGSSFRPQDLSAGLLGRSSGFPSRRRNKAPPKYK